MPDEEFQNFQLGTCIDRNYSVITLILIWYISIVGPTIDMYTSTFKGISKLYELLPEKVEEPTSPLEHQLYHNMEYLVQFAKRFAGNRRCSKQNYIILSKQTYGRTGNALIELKNGLWFANQTGSMII